MKPFISLYLSNNLVEAQLSSKSNMDETFCKRNEEDFQAATDDRNNISPFLKIVSLKLTQLSFYEQKCMRSNKNVKINIACTSEIANRTCIRFFLE